MLGPMKIAQVWITVAARNLESKRQKVCKMCRQLYYLPYWLRVKKRFQALAESRIKKRFSRENGLLGLLRSYVVSYIVGGKTSRPWTQKASIFQCHQHIAPSKRIGERKELRGRLNSEVVPSEGFFRRRPTQLFCVTGSCWL